MQARDYQSAAISAAIADLKFNQSTVVVCPTGTGKTVIFGEVIKYWPGRVIVLAHREELIFQAAAKIYEITGIECGMELAGKKSKGNESVIVASVQSMLRRLDRFKPEDFSLIIRDEAHHATSATDRKIIDHFQQNPKLKLLGVTATPDRGDKQAIGQIFNSMAYELSLTDAMAQGWLVPVQSRQIYLPGVDLSRARITTGPDKDLNNADLAAEMEKDENIKAVTDSAFWEIGSRKAIAFTASVLQAKLMVERFNQKRPDMAFSIDGNTPNEERRQKLKDFSTGKYQVFCNCGIATEGYDSPDTSAIIMAKLTLVRSHYTQMAGRGLRVLPNTVENCGSPELRKLEISRSAKKDCLIIDYTTNSSRLELMKLADIFDGDMHPDEKGTSHMLGNDKTVARSNKGMWQVRGVSKNDLSLHNLSHSGMHRLKMNSTRITAQKSIGMVFLRNVFHNLFSTKD